MDLPLKSISWDSQGDKKNFNLRTKEADASKFLLEASLIHRLPLLVYPDIYICSWLILHIAGKTFNRSKEKG